MLYKTGQIVKILGGIRDSHVDNNIPVIMYCYITHINNVMPYKYTMKLICSSEVHEKKGEVFLACDNDNLLHVPKSEVKSLVVKML